MAKNIQNVRVDPGRVPLDLELYLGAWGWVVCIFFGPNNILFDFYDAYVVCGVQEMP